MDSWLGGEFFPPFLLRREMTLPPANPTKSYIPFVRPMHTEYPDWVDEDNPVLPSVEPDSRTDAIDDLIASEAEDSHNPEDLYDLYIELDWCYPS